MMMNNNNILYIFLALVVGITSCKTEEAEVELANNFVKIYNNEDFKISYQPLDIKQTKDGGFIILGIEGSNNTYISRITDVGEFLSDTVISSPYTNPLSELIEINDAYHFFSMDDVTLGLHLLKVSLSDSSQIPEVVKSFPEIIYPLHASQTPDGGFIVQSYNRDDKTTVMTKLNGGFSQVWQEEYEVLEDVEEKIIAKFAGTGERTMPYFTGSADDGGTYFFNGYFNFNFSMVFVNASTGEMTGVLNGLREETGVSAAVHLGGAAYALSRYSFGDSFIAPKGEVTPQDAKFSGEIEDNKFAEIEAHAVVKIKRLVINGKNVVAYGTHTKSKQIVLYLYDEADGVLLGVKYFGDVNPYEFGGFSLTNDGGLVLLGRTFVAGRFPRMVVFKMSQEDLNSLVE